MMQEDQFSIKVGLKIKQLREEKNITQLQLADKCDMEKNNIGRIENGRRSIKLFTLARICKAFDMSLSEFLKDF
ncbi:MAG: helix-turn-helix domain-containing protein [Prevotellaceae bacterium]|jgi:transcriptional regulator with XRE-family HTH domain|nr:helix-turn-helix domain-containing protein [Prevotellaceae bacterium]